ncbi:hypothetical protein GCM10027446_21570 [Angustibacter peucedani]
MSGPVPPFVVPPGGGTPLRGPVGGPVTIKAHAGTTNGAVTALESVIAPGEGPPMHVHVREDEMYYVLDGTVRFSADGDLFDTEPGSFMFIPRATAHCFQNVGDGFAKLLVLFSPAGMERFFEGVAALPEGPVDPATFAEVADRAWMRVLGPRPPL